jgi:hypothetical protein
LIGALPFTTTTIDAGDPSASDTVNLSGATGPVNINLANLTVTGFGGTVSLLGVEHLNVSAGANAITVSGRTTADSFSVTPTGADTATIAVAGLNLTINTDNTGDLTIDGLGGNDTIEVIGTDAIDTVTVTYGGATTTVATTGAKTVTVPNSASEDTLQIETLNGADTITLVNTAAITTVVNGGDPETVDTMVYTVGGNARVTQGAVSTSGLIDQTGGSNVSYSGLQLVSMNSQTADSTLTVRGTDDDDSITVGLSGITAVWTNDGTTVRYNQNSGNFGTVAVQGRL